MRRVLLFLSLILSSGVLFAAQSIGSLMPLQKNAQVYADEQMISAKTPIMKNTVIRIEKGTAELVMTNGDRFTLASGTVMTASEYLDGSSEEKKPSIFQLIRGKVSALIVREEQENEKVIIKTGNAIVGVKGTEFIVEAPTPSVTQLTTISGKVNFRRVQGDEVGDSSIIGTGLRSLIVQEQTPSAPISVSQGDWKQMQQTFTESSAKTQIQSQPVDVVQSTLSQEVERRMVQQALRNQARIMVDITFE